MKYNIPSSAWRYIILHVTTLFRLRSTEYHKFSPLQLVSGRESTLSHLKIFSCAMYVPISQSQCIKMIPQRRLEIYISFNSQSIIKYLESSTGDVFTARFADCQFDETIFLVLGGERKKIKKLKVT
jgi:hypothetical protein